MNCATCKHWMPHEAWDVKAGGLRRCAAVRQKWDVEDDVPEAIKEEKWDWQYDDTPNAYTKAADVVFTRAKAVVNDGSQCHAELLTRPEFGCVLHESSTQQK